MLTIWGRTTSLNVQKVMWTVGELSLPHQRIDAGGRFGGLASTEFRALNPNGLIPVLKDEDLVLWESHAIVRYLCARYGNGSLWTEDARIRAESDKWMEWTSTTLQPTFTGGVFWGFYRTPPAQRNWNAIHAALNRCVELFGILDRVLSDRSFLAGDQLSMADIVAGAQLYRYFTLDIERPRLPHVEAWYQRLSQRPAYATHVMVPYDELRGRDT
ncbi:MAG: glutathione S-transferase [Alphaproteobacteria bacterium]|nr:glutathione S-transferase [Alphaproteobacteria bacterium]